MEVRKLIRWESPELCTLVLHCLNVGIGYPCCTKTKEKETKLYDYLPLTFKKEKKKKKRNIILEIEFEIELMRLTEWVQGAGTGR